MLQIAEAFATDSRVQSAEPFGTGHINSTWRVTCESGTCYVLQRINDRVFPDAMGVARNTAAVCRHLRNAAPRLVPQLVPTRTDGVATQTRDGIFRMLEFVSGRAGEVPLEHAAAYAAGHAFGRLQRALADYDSKEHVVPIDGYFELPRYLMAFDAARTSGGSHRRLLAADQVEHVHTNRDYARIGMEGPAGMLHGDCKIDNLIFHPSTAEVRAVVDLDTVMWGRRAWDFGDLVRSASVRGGEDSPGLTLDLDLYRPIASGFVQGIGSLYDPQLETALIDAPAYVALMLGCRFLTDFLSGDTYFKVQDETHNLRRAQAQLSLFDSMHAQREAMTQIIRSAR